MIKLPSKEGPKREFKLPNLKDVPLQTIREKKLTEGSFIVEVEKCKPIVTRENTDVVVPVFKVLEVENQVPTPLMQDGKEIGTMPVIAVGDLCALYFEFGGKYGYGERDWRTFMRVCGIAEEEEEVMQPEILGANNALAGAQLRIRRYRKSNGYLAEAFEALENKAVA